jgi:hypothetical protein
MVVPIPKMSQEYRDKLLKMIAQLEESAKQVCNVVWSECCTRYHSIDSNFVDYAVMQLNLLNRELCCCVGVTLIFCCQVLLLRKMLFIDWKRKFKFELRALLRILTGAFLPDGHRRI